MVESRRTSCLGQIRNMYAILAGKSLVKGPLSTSGKKIILKWFLRHSECEEVGWVCDSE
jgi:hypothetical protein